MRLNLLKIFIIIITILYQFPANSKTLDADEFNQKYLSNYFSALLSYDNENNNNALKFFKYSRPLLSGNTEFLKKYIFSLVIDGQVPEAIREIKNLKNKENGKFFESNLLLALDGLHSRKFAKTSKLIADLESYKGNDNYKLIIFETLKSFNQLFLNKKIENKNQNFGRLSLITIAFQNCYLNSSITESNFLNLINSDKGDYSRYLFFYLGNIIEKNDYDVAKQISLEINTLNSSLLISQAKKWLVNSNFEKFNECFSCKNEKDILAEFFFLISNLYSSQDEYEKSNFYLNISNYLNPKFYYNLSLLAENYFINNNFELTKKILDKFDKKDEIYNWYKNRKIAEIIALEKNNEESLYFIEKKFKEYKKPSIKILFDMANFYKKYEKYEKAIEYYSILLSKIDVNSETYADILYRRGGSYERLGKHNESDEDMLKSLIITPEEPYVMNYLAYSWLERNYNIDEAIEMLSRAYKQKKNDPYIIDSVGWGYYLIGDYINAEKYLIEAVQLMPDDPIVNDHYADILWNLDRKLEAKYFWENVLNLKKTEEKMKKNIVKKLLKGPEKIN